MSKKITAYDISKLLHKKHSVEKFLCVDECKADSTWFSQRCPRLDMWVMARSYAHPRFIGYEIKISRQDFLKDVKWVDYLKYCTEFYFVVPPDIVDVSEIPEQAGLLVASKNCKVLMTKKKAPVRNVKIPQSILIYILMSRAVVVGDMFQTRPKVEIWKDRLKQIKSNKRLGHTLSYLIRERVNREVKEIKNENGNLKHENNQLQSIKEWIGKKGVNINSVATGYSVQYHKLDELINGLPHGFVGNIEAIVRNLSELLKDLKKTSK